MYKILMNFQYKNDKYLILKKIVKNTIPILNHSIDQKNRLKTAPKGRLPQF